MANPRIEVEIGAKVDMLTKAIDEALGDLDKLGGKSTETSKEVDQISVVSQRASTKIEQVGKQSAQTANQINKLSNATSTYNSIGIDFTRIIQDAPFGIIGVGNNITQLAQSFGQLRAQSTSTGTALKTAFASIFSSGNALVLGISALTTVFTLYQQGVFDSLFANEELNKSFKDLAQSVKSATANSSTELARINALKGIIEDETASRIKREQAFDRLQKKYPAIFSNGDKEKALNGQLTKSYDLLTKSIIQRAEASIAEQELPNLVKQKELVDAELSAKQKILQTEQSLLSTRNKLTPLSQTFSGSDYEQAQRRIKQLSDEVSSLSLTQKGLQINIDGFTESIVSYADEFQGLLEPLNGELRTTSDLASRIERTFTNISKLPSIGLPRSGDVEALRARREQLQAGGQVGATGEEFINAQLEAVKAQGIFTQLPSELSAFSTQYEQFAITAGEFTNQLIDNFSVLGNQIASSLNIGNNALRGFVATVLSNTPKIIQAIFKQAAAKKAAAQIENQGNLQIATGNAVATASKAANALGPVGLALLPVFIGGAIALISNAFNKSGGGGGGFSVGTSGVGSGTSFSGGGLGFAFDASREIRGELVARGQDLVYVFNEASNRINKG